MNRHADDRAVWVTGLGAVTAAGAGAAALLSALADGRSAVASQPDLQDDPVGRAPAIAVDSCARRLDRSAALFVAAAQEAWADAGLEGRDPERGRAAVIEGSSLGPMADLLGAHAASLSGAGRRHVRPTAVIRFMTGSGGAAFAQARRIDGPVLHVSCGSVSAAAAIGEGFLWIAGGRADLVVVGGAECPLHPAILEHFAAAGVLSSSRAAYPCRPFAEDRDGTVLGEGSGVLVLEAAGVARRRGAEPRAVIRGFGLTAEPHSMTAPDPDGRGVADATWQALAQTRGGRPDWIKAHGTASRTNDPAECRGLAAVFGRALPEIPLTALKPYIGHCLGASGAVEAVAVALSLGSNLLPPILGTQRPDPQLPPCTIILEPHESSAKEALLLSESFGGRCAALRMGVP